MLYSVGAGSGFVPALAHKFNKRKEKQMSKWENKELKGTELYLYFIDRFNMSPDEAADVLKEHGHYTDDVCLAHTMLNKHVLKQKGKADGK